MKIYLVRHGQSVGNLRRLWYGSTDHPLTDLGREQARLVGEKLKNASFAVCYASPLSRAWETAQLVMAGRSQPIIPVPDLQEQHMGLLEHKTFDQVAQAEPDRISRYNENWVHETPPEGEAYDTGMAPRVARVLDSLAEKGEDCLLVAHNGPLGYAITYLLDLPIEAAPRFYLHHGCYSMIELGGEGSWNPGRNHLRCFNV